MKVLCLALVACLLAAPISARTLGNELDINWNQIGCDFCTLVFNYIANDLLGEQVTNQILRDIAKVCTTLPSTDEQQTCQNILGSYGPLLINFVKQYIKPTFICPEISKNVCSGN